jgi:serine/threonine protein kinase
MTPERFQLISQIYREALECDHTERVAFLELQCGRDRELRQEVESLLSGGKSAEALLLSQAMNEAVKRLTDETPRSLVGQTLDHYQVLSLSGSGGMGEVYRALDVNLGREVAIKLLPEVFVPVRNYASRGKRCLPNHPNILTIHGIEQADDHRFIVSEFIDGDTFVSVSPKVVLD